MLKELNCESSDEQFECFEARLKEVLAQDNLSEKDMLVFFEAEYSDQKTQGEKKKAGKEVHTSGSKNSKKQNEKENKTDKISKPDSSLLDLNFESESNKLESKPTSIDLLDLDKPGSFMPSSLIDLNHMHTMDSDSLTKADFEQLGSWANYKSNQTAKSNKAGLHKFCITSAN